MSQYYEPPTLQNMGLSLGKRTRLHRLLYQHGPGNGRMLVLPIDQGLEHGPMDFFANPDSKFPSFQYRLARDGGYSAIALHVGLAAKYHEQYAGEVPLILKINGKTSIPPDDEAFSSLAATVEDAVRLGADAVGYTLFVGSPMQDEDIAQLAEVRSECDLLGMPLIVWAYPRGEAVERKGGRDSFYAIDYAARVAQELGADVVKVNFPVIDPEKDKHTPEPYNKLVISAEEAFRQIVQSAGRTFVLVSGGGRMGDDELLQKAEAAMAAGATGLIFGRNMWQRTMDDALKMTERIKKIMLT
ncbi:fructose-bisphosphate aldolase [bacterium]|nr:fructose-bisphosphate aldolase [bacterium]